MTGLEVKEGSARAWSQMKNRALGISSCFGLSTPKVQCNQEDL
jgi:hypothetical protein